MNKSQIYHIPNWETQDDQAWAAVKECLAASSPYHIKNERGALSGVDCMIRVIQHILCTLNRPLSQHLLRHYLSDNFLVDFAMRDFTARTSTRRENMQDARDFWGLLCRQKMGTSDTPSFLEIDQSAMMQCTLWRDRELQAFAKSLVKPTGGADFQAPETLKEYPSDIENVRTSRSLFTWDTSLHKNFEEMFAAHLSVADVDGAHGKYTLPPKPPKLARVLFDPTKARLEGLNIHRLYRMPMAGRTAGDGSRGGEGRSATADRAGRTITYSLVAVVRLRMSQHEHDYVRLYDAEGHPVVPRGPAEECRSYHCDEWSVSDQDHRYMLYYAPFVAPAFSVPPSSCVPPPPSIPMEMSVTVPQQWSAPYVSQTASEVATRTEQPPPGQKSTQELFDNWAAAHRTDLERRAAEKQRAEHHGPSTQGQGRADRAGSGTSPTLPPTAQQGPLTRPHVTSQPSASSLTLGPLTSSQPGPSAARGAPADGNNTGGAQAAQRAEEKPQKPGEEPESSATSSQGTSSGRQTQRRYPGPLLQTSSSDLSKGS